MAGNSFPSLGPLLQKPDVFPQAMTGQIRPEFEVHQAAIKKAKLGGVNDRHPQYQAKSQKNITMSQSAGGSLAGHSAQPNGAKPAPRTNRVVRPVGDPVRARSIVAVTDSRRRIAMPIILHSRHFCAMQQSSV